ncbi:ATP-binding protein [Helicobacter jaachi]|uniref:ATP-binding protein n=1 Tax=Helicobacter jaachi TaxID=1677920 RepID=A0A4V6I2S5_9HELI|nr:dynamin family protein [Helicobacter jaachi]TLD97272.1 ATP-binding protein [Helicobacter jaachi]
MLEQYFSGFHKLSPPVNSLDSMHPLLKSPLWQDTLQNTPALAIILCANRHNLALFMQCPSFMDLFLDSMPNIESSIESALEFTLESLEATLETAQTSKEERFFDSLLTLQAYIIEQNPAIFEECLPIFARLELGDVINKAQLELFSTLKATKKTADSIKPIKSFDALREQFLPLHSELLALVNQDYLKDMLIKIAQKYTQQHFCIAVTGVLSAGKSTFLNALLSQDILGSSSVPETANLTILRYGDKQSAKVYFWSKEQWADLCAQSAFSAHLKAFIDETYSHFGESIESFITQPSLVKVIDISELSAYTSANHPSKLCNLIQKVELSVPLAFLQHGVEIVDTPGLDDPIAKREEITREFLGHCDMLIHVMNASCAATQKDIDFILESLLEQNISRMLVVLTRVDLLESKDIAACLDYTQSSLIAQLKNAHYKGDIQAIINRIDFLTLAGYAALLHRTGGDTSNQISLEQSGILEIESYLHKMLLSHDSLKARDMLYLAYKGTLSVARELEEILHLEMQLLSSDKAKLEAFIEQIKAQNTALLKTLQNLKSHLKDLHSELLAFLQSLEVLSLNALNKSTTLLKDRIFEDISYGSMKEEHIQKMIEFALKDCFGDVGREYKYQLSKKVAELKQTLKLESEAKLPPIHFELTQSDIAKLLQGVLHALPSLLKTHKNRLKSRIDELFGSLTSAFKMLLNAKNKEISAIFLAFFDDITQAQIAHINAQISHKEQILEQSMQNQDESSNEQAKHILQEKQTKLASIIDELSYALHTMQGD